MAQKWISLMRVNNKWVATLRLEGGTVLDRSRGYPRRVRAAIDGWMVNDNAELDFPLPPEFLEALKSEVK